MARGPILSSPDLGRLRGIARDLFLENTRVVDGHLRWRGTYNRNLDPPVPVWSFQGRTTTARKWAYELFVGPVEAGQLVFSVCNDDRCVAPGHTSAGRKAALMPLDPDGLEIPEKKASEKTWGTPYVKPVKADRRIRAGGNDRRRSLREVANMTDKFLGWRITDHARGRAEELGFTINEVLLTAGDPENVYPTPSHGEDEWIHQRGKLSLGVIHGSRVIKTVLLRTDRQWEHGRDSVETISLPD